MNLLTNEQARKMFDQESILIGTNNVVTMECVHELFGAKAVKGLIPGKHYNTYTFNEYCVEYVYFAGFQKVATHYNILKIMKDKETPK